MPEVQPGQRDRAAVAAILCEYHLQCKERLTQWLEEQILLDQVELGEPGFLPSLGITCPPFISKLLATHPDVEAVISGDIPFHLIK